jgi:hypothetical protein
MDKILRDNICFKLGAKPDELLFSELNFAWSDLSNGSLILERKGQNVWAILILNLYISESGNSTGIKIMDGKITGKVLYASDNAAKTRVGFPFYYLVVGGNLNLTSVKNLNYGVNYITISKQKNAI